MGLSRAVPCCRYAAGEAAAARYLGRLDETVAQVGGHKPPCAFASSERGEASFDYANMVGCICGFFAKKEKSQRKKERRKKSGQRDK